MSTLEHIEDEIRNMSPADLARFRKWFLEFDSRQWDKQIEQDAQCAVAAMRALPRIKGADAAEMHRAGGQIYKESD